MIQFSLFYEVSISASFLSRISSRFSDSTDCTLTSLWGVMGRVTVGRGGVARLETCHAQFESSCTRMKQTIYQRDKGPTPLFTTQLGARMGIIYEYRIQQLLLNRNTHYPTTQAGFRFWESERSALSSVERLPDNGGT